MIRGMVFGLAGLLIVTSLGSSREPTADTSESVNSHQKHGVITRTFMEGKTAYTRYCIGCHGLRGDGQGESAGFMNPRPANFILAHFKFSSTRAGQLPTDDDLRRTIREGLRDSAMPGWPRLSDSTIDALIVYIKSFSPRWAERKPASHELQFNNPFRSHGNVSDVVARGEAVYHGFATCWTCHPAYVSTKKINEYLKAMENQPRDSWRPDLQEAQPMLNEQGGVVYPPDFKRDVLRAGEEVEDLYRAIAMGITGSAMPTWVDSMDYKDRDGRQLVQPTDLWAMTYYVQSLTKRRPDKLLPGHFTVRHRPAPIFLDGHTPPTPAKFHSAEEPQGVTGEDFTEN